MAEFSDAEVMWRSRSSPEEFGLIFDRHFGPIHRYLARRLSTADADELAGEVFRIAFEKRLSFDQARESALPWLYGIASNLVLKHRRREGRAMRAIEREQSRFMVDAGSLETAVDDRLDAEASHALIVRSLGRLSFEERELVMLAAFTELGYRELAEATGLSPGTVKSKLSRSKAKLREQLSRRGEKLVSPPNRATQGGTA